MSAVVENSGRRSSSAISFDVPSALQEYVAYDAARGVVYVDRRKRSDMVFLNWYDRMKRAGRPLKVETKAVDEIAKLREEVISTSDTGEDDDLKNRQLALDLLKKSAAYRASDMHILLRGTFAEVQIRVKGELRVLDRFTNDEGERIVRAVYQGLATVRDRSYNPLEVQNAQISGENLSGLGLTSVRIVRGPAYPQEQGGGFAILRLQYSDFSPSQKRIQALPQLQEPRKPEGEFRLGLMGYSDKQQGMLRMLSSAPNGVIFFTGPTGSGKTTSQAEIMRHVARIRSTKRQVTIEDPVEIPMPWAIQMPVTNATNEEKTGDGFEKGVRDALRMDPNIILLGEIRGAETAKALINAALTGHLALSTLHVTDPFLFVDRIELMDPVNLNRQVFCDPKIIRGVVAQRLVPPLCPDCSRPYTDAALDSEQYPDELFDALSTWGDISKVRVRGPGCNLCSGDGVSGIKAVAEVVMTDSELMANMIEHGTTEARRIHRGRAETDNSLLSNAIDLVLSGVVDPIDVNDSVDLIIRKEAE